MALVERGLFPAVLSQHVPPRVEFEIHLFDSANGALARKAVTLTRGNAYANYETMVRSLSAKIVRTYASEAGTT